MLCADTGRLVQTGCAGPMEARLSVMRAVRQLQLEAGIPVRVRNFAVINEVGAASLQARLDCDRFATTHSSSAHYDRQVRTPLHIPLRTLMRLPFRRAVQSFVGLAWRAPHEACCCEIYQTGRSNLPGSVRERDMLRSFSRMYPQLILHSDHPERIALVPPHLRDAHKPVDNAAPADAPGASAAAASTLAAPAGEDAWAPLPLPPLAAMGGAGPGRGEDADDDDDVHDDLLAAAGL